MNPISQLGLFFTAMALIVLPFLPTLREWLVPTDDAPLPIDQNATHELRHFADSFRKLIDHLLGSAPTRDELHRIGKTLFHNGAQVTLLHDGDGLDVLETGFELEEVGRLAHIAIFADEARIAANCQTQADIYAVRDIQVGSGVQLRACCSAGNMRLAQNVLIHRWADAQTIVAGRDLIVHGRITALDSIRFSDNTQFVRAGAPTLYFGESDDAHISAPPVQPLSAPSSRRYLLDGDTTISDEMPCDGDFVVRGSAQVVARSVVRGSIKAHDFLRLHENVSVSGSVISARGIVIGAGCAILGPLISEDDIIIGPNSVVGSAATPTTVICRKLIVAQGVVIHGVVTTQDSAYVVFEEIAFGN
ncbi:polymer-forming cytoskeletal protein [Bordetella sp. FB-8]|uniref:polymer-forming cytoskeletal protein n=1 Tax=Bordetella sp. FB-8 TaxID=1159870 RepID=UPI000363C78B|nr:polymer-forming cytoskeletal protein [Bordetella sp. FB-8]